MSDKQKGLEQAIKELFPDAAHRHCVRHLHNNFKNDGHTGLELKQKLWVVARSCTMNTFNEAMEDLKKSSLTGWQWCLDRPAKHWSKSHFDHKFKCDFLLNNHSESFNKSVLPARKKPILACLEEIRLATMVRLANRRNSGPNWKCKVGPRVEKQLKKNAESSHEYRPVPSSLWRYEVQGRGVGCKSGVVAQQSVALDLRSCTCQRWDVSGLPCEHGIAGIYSKGMTPDDFVDPYYSKDMYMKAYEPVMHPITGVTEWEKINRPIAPPLYRKQPGRPKTARTKEPGKVFSKWVYVYAVSSILVSNLHKSLEFLVGEVAPPPGLTKLPKVYYSQVTCGICKQKGHNKRTCKKINEVTRFLCVIVIVGSVVILLFDVLSPICVQIICVVIHFVGSLCCYAYVQAQAQQNVQPQAADPMEPQGVENVQPQATEPIQPQSPHLVQPQIADLVQPLAPNPMQHQAENEEGPEDDHVATQQSQVTTATESSSQPQFKARRFKSLARRKPRPQ
ncbi:uncharacterized protein LOC121051088 [Rosa chinensis]|uniref:uncharacterized protein LOC121051088 n=1 Tax=Rosa chinensis TaxID=74649 RepID=UPI001AD8ACFF|nr:uncharacterized protein LOC121051088 [Rosa chinensis]